MSQPDWKLDRRARSFAETHFERDAILEKMFALIEAEEGGVAGDVAILLLKGCFAPMAKPSWGLHTCY
jgi:hypothetical protein